MKKSDEYSNTFDKKMEQPRPGVNYSFQNSSFQNSKWLNLWILKTVNLENTLENRIGNEGIDMFPFIDKY